MFYFIDAIKYKKESLVEKIWLKSYEPDVPETIDPDAYSSIVTLAQACFQKYRDKPCYINFGKVLTYAQIEELSTAFAGFLQKKCFMTPGDRVVIMLPNLMQYPVAMFGTLKAGMTVVNVNPLYTPRELSFILKDSGAKCVVVLENFASVLEKVLPQTDVQHVIVTQMGDLLGPIKGRLINFVVKHVKKLVPRWHIPHAYDFKETIKQDNAKIFTPVEIKSEDVAYLQYTGGTTGGPKGAMLTHRNMVANILQACAWIDPFFKQEMQGGIITALPLYHIFSLTANCLTFLKMGLPNILIVNPRDIKGFVKELKRYPFSVMTGVNTLYNALLHNEEFCKMDFSKFKFALAGGMALQQAVADKWQEVTGVTLLEAYGLTEASPAVTINPLTVKKYNGFIGLPVSSTLVKFCDDKGNEVPLGQPGELYVKGPQVMKGYWKQPEKTAEVLVDGWLKTGDIATMNEAGFIHLVDRKKDIIIVSGFNVYPNEVEDVIASMKGVREVGVIGVPSIEHGEVVKAYIVRSNPHLTAAEVLAFCHKGLTGYKVPKEIEFRDELPKTNVGKVLRRALREEVILKEAR